MKPSARADLYLFRRLLSQARPYWGQIVCVLLLSMLAAPLALLTPVPLKLVVDHVLGDEPLPASAVAILPDVFLHSPSGLLGLAVALLLLISLLQNLEGFSSWLLQLYTGEKLVLEFRARMFRHVQRLSLLYHDMRGTSDSFYRIQSDAPAMQYLVIQGVIPFFTSGVTILAMLWVTAKVDRQLAVVATFVLPLLFLTSELYRRKARGAWAEVKQRESIAFSVVQEVLASLRVVKAFGQEGREEQRFYNKSASSLNAQLKAVLVETGFGIAVAMIVAGGTAAVLYIGVRHVQTGSLTLGNLLLVMGYLAQLYKPLEVLSKKIGTLQSSFASAERAFALLDESPDVPERRHAKRLLRAVGDVELRGVQFTYPGADRVLSDVSFRVSAGMRVGISGPTGAGKTTLVSLLPRFFDPTEGQVMLDGVDIREYRLADLRQQFALVLQEPVLFATTIAENISYGRPEADQEAIAAAAKAANAHDFIARMPDGYETVVGERGMRLSGGERQRISIARAFLRDAPILILDEPTSSVDTDSESAIMNAMERLMRGRTTFIIAHRLGTLEHCDLRLQVAHGHVTELPTVGSSAV